MLNRSPQQSSSATDRVCGTTLVEVSFAVAIIGILVAISLSAATESSRMVADAHNDFLTQHEGRRSIDRLSRELRRSGRHQDGATTYPLVTNDGAELQFRIPDSPAYDPDSGERLWNTTVFTVRRDDSSNILGIFADDGADPVLVLGQDVAMVEFATIDDDATLRADEVRITLRTERPTTTGQTLGHDRTAVIRLRN